MNSSQITIEHKINESNTTTVYRAFDTVLQRKILLKVLHKHTAADPEFRARFIREARAIAALRSEHIVQIYDLTEWDGTPAIIMEYVEGNSLKEGIAEGSHIGLGNAKKTALHVLRALSVAHSQRIIHRDIKPGNILISSDGTMKVTDFGLAYVSASPTVTMEGMVLGTPAYMSPEQIRGEEVDVRTDLFALGATIVEVLSGERIFEGSTYSECMKKILAYRESELDRYIEHSSPEFVGFLKKLTHPKKEERFSLAKEALAALDERKSSSFFYLTPNTPPKRKMYFLLAAIIPSIIFLIVFGKSIFTQPAQANDESIISVDSAMTSQQHMTDKLSETNTKENGSVQSVKSVGVGEKNEGEKIVSIPDSGKIFLTSSPWAKVYVNNYFIGETPMAKPVILAAGTHTVMFTNPAFEPIVKTVSVEANKEKTVSGNFLENVGYVQCTVVPWAEVYIDEQYKDTTPLSKPVMVSNGKHMVRFKNKAFSDIVKEIVVNSQDTIQLSITFTQ